MTRYPNPSEFQTGSRPEQTERLIGLARLALLWERAWPAAWPAVAVLGVFAALALLDLYGALPWPVHALILGLAIAAVGLLLYFGFRHMHIPTWTDGARRLERDSGLQHRPISEGADALAVGGSDAFALSLWQLHLRQLLAGVRHLRVAAPRPDIRSRDPYSLRYLVLLLVVAGVALAGTGSARRLWAALHDTGAAANATIDAWIDPPAYTGVAPVYLNSGMRLAVPIGSTLHMRVHGASHAPGLALDTASNTDAAFTGGNGEYGATWKIGADANVRVRSSGRAIGDWSITAIPDRPPAIAFAGRPAPSQHGALKFSYRAADDYGVTAVRAVITPQGRRGKPLIVDLGLAATSSKRVAETSYQDLTAHPYAGTEVDIVLQAVDAAGQTGTSKPMTLRLPARVFTNPLARALVEQRQILETAATQPERSRVVRMLDALTYAPQLFFQNQTSVYMAIRAARWALANAQRVEDVQHVQDLLWQIAISLERGGLLSAAQELRNIAAQIAQALAQGAPQEVIDELLRKYNEAMQRYMQAMEANPDAAGQPPPPNTKVLSQKDLETLLKAIQQLAASGDRAQAQQLMALLQSLLENLRVGQGGGGGDDNNPQNKAMRDAIGKLGDLMGKQRGLLDKTFKGQQGGAVDPKGLQKEQGDIQKQLDDVLKGLGGQKIPAPNNLGRAGRSMGQSQQELGSNDLGSSSVDQKNALDAMRGAARELANRLAKEGKDGENGDEDEDPLGRNNGNGPNFGNNVKVPDRSELERARDILKELRRRAGERGRPQEELDYIDRLLKTF